MSELAKYDFELPEELIAQHPLPNRADSRLMVVNRAAGTIGHRSIHDLPEFLNPGDRLVLNDTKVLPARLVGFRTATGGRWEGLFLEFAAQNRWKIMFKSGGRIRSGETVTLEHRDGTSGFLLEMSERCDDGTWLVKPLCEADSTAALEAIGRVPLPPYIRGGRMEDGDLESYQTVYAKSPGAVAAPTAGLHFTEEMLNQVGEKGVIICPVTLHVGVGTFRPISVERLAEHPMHREFAYISDTTAAILNNARPEKKRIIAVGTTSLRTLESAAGDDGTVRPFAEETNLFIRPPYRFKAVDALLTNFHFPKSTLYILLRTFGGDELIKHAYEEAIREKYRFYSYGDAMLVY